MKRWIVIALVAVMALAAVPLAAAGGGGGQAKGKSKFNLVGTVTAVDPVGMTLTVKVKAGTKTVKAFRGLDLVLAVDPAAKVRLVSAEGCTTVTLADVPVGARVKVRGGIDRTDPLAPAYVARVVKAKATVVVTPEPAPSPAD